MPICHCVLPLTNPKACENCSVSINSSFDEPTNMPWNIKKEREFDRALDILREMDIEYRN